MKACILTEDEDAIALLRAKEEKKRKVEEKKRKAEEKKKAAPGKKTSAPKQKPTRTPAPQESSTDDEEDLAVLLNDSSDFEEEFGQDDFPMDGSYPFVDKQAEVGVGPCIFVTSLTKLFRVCL